MRRYRNTPVITSLKGKKIYSTVRYPIIPKSINDTYVNTTIGDRFDTLAQQFYGDSSLWWVISVSNDNLPQDSLTPPVGSQIRIPNNISSILANYKDLNTSSTTSEGNSGNTSTSY